MFEERSKLLFLRRRDQEGPGGKEAKTVGSDCPKKNHPNIRKEKTFLTSLRFSFCQGMSRDVSAALFVLEKEKTSLMTSLMTSKMLGEEVSFARNTL